MMSLPTSGREMPQDISGCWHMDTQNPRHVPRMEKRVFPGMTRPQTLISALSACILVSIWDGRPVPTRYPHTRLDTTLISLDFDPLP